MRGVGGAAGSAATRVAVLSNHELMRAGVSQFLSHHVDSFSVVEGPFRTGLVTRPDVVLYDLADASGNSLDALAALLAEGAPVVALTSPGRPHLAETVLAMGVAETVPMDIGAAGLGEALERAAAGRSTSPEDRLRRHRDGVRAGTRLTDREVSVLELIGAGMSNREITERLHVSINTLKTYIRTAYRKIGVSRRAQAVLWAAQHGLVPVSGTTDLRDRPGRAVTSGRPASSRFAR